MSAAAVPQAVALGVGYVYACWLVYILVMGLYRAHLAGRLHRGLVTYWLAAPVVVVGFAMDVVLQLLATVVFLDLPRYQLREWLLTDRLQRYMAGPDGWRKRWADWICTHALDLFDPRGSHC